MSLTDHKRAIKYRLLKNRRVVGVDGEIHACEIQAYKEHKCKGGTHMNEVFFKKNDFTKLSTVDKYYFYHAINCHICCGDSHTRWGHSMGWKDEFLLLQEDRFGQDVVKSYLDNAPLEISWV